MKLTLRIFGLLFFFCSVIISGVAQFVPVGSEWHYNELVLERSYSHHTCLKDTTFLGFKASKIDHWLFDEYGNEEFIGYIFLAQKGDTVYNYRKDLNKFVIHFYPGNVGDTLLLNGYNHDSVIHIDNVVYIKEITTIVFAGKSRKQYNIHTPQASSRYIEGIGYDDMINPLFFGAYPAIYAHYLRCFNGERYRNLRPENEACDYRLINNVNQPKKNFEISIFPNPVSSRLSLTFSNANQVTSIHLINSLGDEVFKSSNVHSKLEIPVEEFQKGIYFLQVYLENEIETYRIIIE